jgi:hydroxyacylglutathione hydrolase
VSEELIHEIIPVGMLRCNCSILGDPGTREAIVVDPGGSCRAHPGNFAGAAAEWAGDCEHAYHIDHVGGLARLHAATKAPVLIHEAGLELYRHLDERAQFLGMRAPENMRIEERKKTPSACCDSISPREPTFPAMRNPLWTK